MLKNEQREVTALRVSLIKLVVGILTISWFSPTVWAQPLSAKIDALIDQKAPHATVGVVVQNAQTGQVIYSRNATKLLSPASSMKLFTAAAALYQLPPTYQFVTTLAQKDQNLYLTFRGAPDLTTADLNNLLANLQRLGTNKIQGDIVLDISRFQPPYYSAGVSYDDLGWYYSAPETAVILNENAVNYDFISAKNMGMPIAIKPKTSDQILTLINQVKTVSLDQEKYHCALHIDTQAQNTVRLFGCLGKTDTPKQMQLAVPDPLFLAKQMITAYLKKNNIILQGHINIGHTPSDAKIIAQIRSKNLNQLLAHMLKNSDNLYANSISRTLAYALTGEGSNKQAAFALKKILSQHTHLDMTQMEIADGIGTRYNLTTPQQIVTLLTDIYRDKKLQPIFFQALPQSGISGSLQNRMKTSPLNKLVLAKTGTMHDISSLSGYLLKQNASPLAFSIIVNGINTPIRSAKALEEQILALIQTDMR